MNDRTFTGRTDRERENVRAAEENKQKGSRGKKDMIAQVFKGHGMREKVL